MAFLEDLCCHVISFLLSFAYIGVDQFTQRSSTLFSIVNRVKRMILDYMKGSVHIGIASVFGINFLCNIETIPS